MSLGELFAGLSLGTLVVLGTYISMTASPGTPLKQLLPAEVIWISIPPGILTSLLLLINQFPDVEADKKGGRKHLVIRVWYQTCFIYIYIRDVRYIWNHSPYAHIRYFFPMDLYRAFTFAACYKSLSDRYTTWQMISKKWYRHWEAM